MNNNLDANIVQNNKKKIDWFQVQKDFKEKFGVDVYESWLKKN